jgi:hypothetical protein
VHDQMIRLLSVAAIVGAVANKCFVGEVRMDDRVRGSAGILILQSGSLMCSRPSDSYPRDCFVQANEFEEEKHVQA